MQVISCKVANLLTLPTNYWVAWHGELDSKTLQRKLSSTTNNLTAKPITNAFSWQVLNLAHCLVTNVKKTYQSNTILRTMKSHDKNCKYQIC